MSDTEQILADPGSHTVEEVTSALAGLSADDVAAVKEREGQGKGRAGILGYEHPSEVTQDEFSTDEKYSAAAWRERHGWFDTSPHAIAGALHDSKPGETFTQDQVRKRVEQFLKRKAS